MELRPKFLIYGKIELFFNKSKLLLITKKVRYLVMLTYSMSY